MCFSFGHLFKFRIIVHSNYHRLFYFYPMVTTDLESFATPSPNSVFLTNSVFVAISMFYPVVVSLTFHHLLMIEGFKEGYEAFKINFVQHCLKNLAFEFSKVLELL